MSALTDFSTQRLPLIRSEIQQFLDHKHSEATKLSPHLAASVQMLSEFTLRGGKSIRGLLTVLGYQLAGGTEPGIYAAAAGVELTHKFFLNLDDMADRDERRYGGPTTWKAYEAKFATWPDVSHHARTFSEIDGTLLCSFAYELVRQAQLPAERIIAAIGLINQVMYWHTVAGWQIQYMLNQVPLSEATEAEFIKGMELVTAEYTFVAPLQIGVVLASDHPDQELFQAMQSYGESVGTAFQMHDDILGLFGDADETGKPVGNDVREGKKTLLLQRAYQQAKREDQEFLAHVCGHPLSQSELQRVQALVRQTGALQYAQDFAQRSVAEGLAVLEHLDSRLQLPHQHEIQVLRELAQFVIERKK